MSEITITISGPDGSGKSLIAETLEHELRTRGFNDARVSSSGRDYATPEDAPSIRIEVAEEASLQMGTLDPGLCFSSAERQTFATMLGDGCLP